MKRALFLSLFVLVSIATVLPFIETAERDAEAATSVSRGHRRHRMSARRYRAWLRRQRAIRRRRQLALARARARRRRAVLMARRQAGAPPVNRQPVRTTPFVKASAPAETGAARSPLVMRTPDGWQREASSAAGGQTRFMVRGGAAVFAPLQVAVAGGPRNAGRHQIGGVSFATLRRLVIDKMIEERGWVVNDMERQAGDRRVFVVVAQTGDQQAWAYYFTEVNGQLYSLTVKTAVEAVPFVHQQAEQFMASLRATGSQPAIAAEPNR